MTSAAAVALVATSAAGPGYAAETYVVSGGTLNLAGVGYGHGVGLSQYGARGGANAGAGPAQILSTYYPGSQLGAEPGAWVRVLLTRYDGTSSCVSTPEAGEPCFSVLAEPGSIFINQASGGTVTAPTSINGVPVTHLAVGSSSAGLRLWAKAGTWQPADPGAFTGPVDIVSWDGVQTARFANGTQRAYRGALRTSKASDTTVHRINVLPMQDYLLGVVPDEMPASWPDAAVQAQGVAAATYAAAQMRTSTGRSYDLCDTTSCQVYGGVGSENASGTAKLNASPLRGQILTTGGVPITAFFSSSNGGWSVPGGTGYLPARQDPWDPKNAWTRGVGADCMTAKYPGRGQFTGVTVLTRDGRGEYGGRVTSLRLNFASGSVNVGNAATPMGTDAAIRGAFSGCGGTGGINSSMFTGTVPKIEPGPGRLVGGQSLSAGQSLPSLPSGQHQLAVAPQGGAGAAVTSRTCPALFGIMPPGSLNGTGLLAMQTDGNLVFYPAAGAPWSTGTWTSPGSYLTLQPDGNLVLYTPGGQPLWWSGGTCDRMLSYQKSAFVPWLAPQLPTMLAGDQMVSPNRRTVFTMQSDGNLVLYRDGVARWSTGTWGNPGARLVLQPDGNLVVYSAAGAPLWWTGTSYGPQPPTDSGSTTVVVVDGGFRVIGQPVDVNTGQPNRPAVTKYSIG